MKTIAISNQKGGVGKTTTAVSLSVALARQGKRVLLIDADSQADATKYLGVENPDELQNTLSAAMHCIINDLPYKTGGYIQSHPEGLDFVPSSIDLSSVEVELVNAMSRERILKTFLDDVRGKYDYALIDCPPSLGMMPVNALSAADSVLIPVQAQYFSMRGLLQLIRTIDKVQRRQNPRLRSVSAAKRWANLFRLDWVILSILILCLVAAGLYGILGWLEKNYTKRRNSGK